MWRRDRGQRRERLGLFQLFFLSGCFALIFFQVQDRSLLPARYKVAYRRLGESLSDHSGDSSPNSTDHVGNENVIFATHDEHSAAHGSSEEHAAHGPGAYPVIIFMIVCISICSLIDHVNSKIPESWRMPYTVVLFVIGMVFGALAHSDKLSVVGDGIRTISRIDAHMVFFVFLPMLLYESASQMSWHVLRKVLPSSILLALPGVALNIALIGGVVLGVFKQHSDVWTAEAAFLMASILSATDPVAVVAALANLGAPKKLSTLVEGESLLNDGSAVVFFLVLMDMVATNAPPEEKKCDPITGACVLGFFAKLAFGGVLFGYACALLMTAWLKSARYVHVQLEVAIVMCFVYGTFFVAEGVLGVSGVLAVVAFGSYMASGGHLSFSHHGTHMHHAFVGQMAYFCNQALFFIAGIISERFMFEDAELRNQPEMWLHLILLYVLIHITRGLITILFSPLLMRLGYGITKKEMAILVFGGLRGAVGLAMGLLVESNPYIDKKLSSLIAFHVSGIVLLTLLINGSTVDFVYDRLKLYPANPFRMVYVRKALRRLEQECQDIINESKHDWFLKDVDIQGIEKCIPNFNHIRFNHAGQPVPERYDTVTKTLNGLEGKAQEFRQSIWSKDGESSYTKSLSGIGEEDPEYAQRPSLRDWMMHDCKSQENLDQFKGDKLVRTDARHHVLEYVAEPEEEHQMLKGVYLSSRSLKHLKSLEWTANILKHNGVVLGFVSTSSFKKMSTYSFESENSEQPDLAQEGKKASKLSEASSVTNVASSESNHSLEHHVKSNHSFAPSNMVKATVTAVRKTVNAITHHHDEEDEEEEEKLPDMGQAPLSIGFRCSDGVLLVHDGVSAKEIQGCIPNSRTIKVMVQDTPDRDCRVCFVQEPGPKILAECRLNVHSNKLMPMVELHVQKNACEFEGAAVRLSFEPQVGSLTDSLNEMFHVLFNALQRQYLHLHDHAHLSPAALLVLSDAIERGEDAANHEVNAEHASDLLDEVENQVKSSPTAHSDRHTLAFVKHTRSVSENWREHIAERVSRWRDQVDFKPKLKSQNERLTALQVNEFEPLVVEYLTLENFLASESFWDRFTNTWLRQFGFHRLRRKVESLWAFVEAHEKMLTELPSMTQGDHRFPGLMRRLREICEEGKSDMGILEKSQPRRFFYAKHFLACRFMASVKLRKLEQYAAEGWLPSKDLGCLELAMHRTIRDIRRFHPRWDVKEMAYEVVGKGTDYHKKVEPELKKKESKVDSSHVHDNGIMSMPLWASSRASGLQKSGTRSSVSGDERGDRVQFAVDVEELR